MCKSVPHCFYYVRISQFSLRYFLTATCQDKINLFRTEEHKTSLTAYREKKCNNNDDDGDWKMKNEKNSTS